jgi:hypothetical protein
MKALPALLLICSLFVGTGAAVHAEEKSRATAVATAVAELKKSHNERAVAKCETVETRVKTRSEEVSKAAKEHDTQYDQLVTRLTTLITRAEVAGYDATTLRADLKVLKAKIAVFKTDKASYVTALAAVQTSTCDKEEGEFRGSLKTAREKLKQVHTDVADIRSFFTTTLQPDIRALKRVAQATTK